jgi:CelD/BcsL family acetyltransferase involved in cellulose biosynthesis
MGPDGNDCSDKKTPELFFSLERLNGTEALGAQWRDLEARADCSFFLSWDWIGTWLGTAPGPQPLLLTVRDSDTIIALGIFQTAKLKRRFMPSSAITLNRTGDPYNDIINIEYNDLLVDRHYPSEIWTYVLTFLKRAEISDSPFKKWDELHVAMATQKVEMLIARDPGLMTLELAHKPSWFVDLDLIRRAGKPYLETLSSNARYQIRRAIRLYEKHGSLVARHARSLDEAGDFFAELKDLHQVYWTGRGMPGGFSNHYFESFHWALIQKCLTSGTVEMVRVSAGSKLIGQVYNFVYRNHVYSYQTGFRYEEDQKAKPGLVSHYLCIQHHLEGGALVYDFMAGDNRYKRTFGTRGPDMAHYVFQRRTPLRLTERLLRRTKNLIWVPGG